VKPNEGSQPLGELVTLALEQYFDDLNGEIATDLYALFLKEVEKPLLQVVLRETNGNLSMAAKVLGINRGTLRTRLNKYGLKSK
jgi:Fis family transcriptional regulator